MTSRLAGMEVCSTHGVSVSTAVCSRCGAAIEWRQSARTGRKYPVNAVGSVSAGQFHSTTCTGRKSQGEKAEQSGDSQQKATAHVNGAGDGLAQLIAEHVAGLVSAPLDESRVRELIGEAMSGMTAGVSNVSVSVRGSDAPAIDVGRQHERFPILLQIIGRRRNVWLVGPAGSGKTSAAHSCAKALNLQFGSISVGPQTTQSALFGYMDAHGNYVSTEFRRRYEQGGVFLFDEIDRGNPGVLTALNQAIENGACAFPDAMVPRHADFVAIAAANTYGNGASREYVGALQIDAATLDRFVMLAWSYDEALEHDIAKAVYDASGGTDGDAFSRWLSTVRTARNKAETLKIRHVISPRASIVGAELLAVGMALETVTDCVLWKGLDADSKARLQK